MQHILPAIAPQSQVMALFADRVLSFPLFNGATLADLADRLDRLDEGHTGLPTAVFLKFANPNNRAAGIGIRQAA